MGAISLPGGIFFHLFRIAFLLLVVLVGICSSSISSDLNNEENGIFRKDQLQAAVRTRRSVNVALPRFHIKKPGKKPMKPRSIFEEMEEGKQYHASMTTAVKSESKQYKHWAKKCTESLNDALEFYEFYEGTKIRCHQHCNNSIRFESNEIPSHHPEARHWEGRIKQYFCFENCTKTFFNHRADVISKKIFKEMELGELYFYLHDCYYVMGDLDKAGLIAFKYTSIKPERRKELVERLEEMEDFYRAEKPRREISLDYFLKGLEYIEAKNIYGKNHMEKSVEEYLKSEEECRYRCEKPDPEFEYAPNIFFDLAHHYKLSLKCKRKCVDKLGHLSDYAYDYLKYDDFVRGRKGTALFFLPDAYIEQREYAKARQSIASYRLLCPEDDVDHWSKKMPESERSDQYIPRADIVRYVERDEAEKKLVNYIEQKERERREDAISANSIQDIYNKGKDAANKQDWHKCIRFMQKSVNDYNFYVDSFIYCRQECKQQESNQTFFAPEYFPLFKHEEQIIRQSFCLAKCIDDENRLNEVDGEEARAYIMSSQTMTNFEKLTPYEYLLVCYREVNDIRGAASSAKAYLSVFYNDENKAQYYRTVVSQLADQDIPVIETAIENPEHHRVDDYYLETFKFAADSLKRKLWSDSIEYFSESVTYYIKSENECRTKCEMGLYSDRRFHADLTAYALNYYFLVMECKLWCGKKYGNLDRYGYSLSYNKRDSNPYIQMYTAYNNLGDWNNSCSALSSWKLTMDPDSQSDSKRLKNLKKELEKKNVTCNLTTGTVEASLYNSSHVEQNTVVNLFDLLFHSDSGGISDVRKVELESSSYLPNVPVDHSTSPSLHWWFYFNMYHTQPFGRNLLLNAGTTDNFNHWIVGCQEGKANHTITKQTAGIENPPLGLLSLDVGEDVEYDLLYGIGSFVTSSIYCYKYQDISLSDLGLSVGFMDKYKPTISFSTSYTCRVDAKCLAVIGFLVYNEKREIVRKALYNLAYDSSTPAGSWNKLNRTYRGDESNYPAGASFLRFYHGGMTKELFHGRYGTKFAFNSVQLQLE